MEEEASQSVSHLKNGVRELYRYSQEHLALKPFLTVICSYVSVRCRIVITNQGNARDIQKSTSTL
jgi:hypothetical protein